MKQRNLILVIASVCLVASVSMILNARGQQATSEAQDSREMEATPLRSGMMTEKQKRHSKLYDRYDAGNKIQDLLRADDNEIQIRRSLPFPFTLSDQVRTTEFDQTKRITCSADAIVVGTVISSVSQITATQTFLFTDYVLLVQESLKNGTPVALGRAVEINLTRPGGTVLIGRKRISAIDESFLPLRKDMQYLLFLRYLPETDSFAPIESGESYEWVGNELRLLKGQSKDSVTRTMRPDPFLDGIRAAVSGPCN